MTVKELKDILNKFDENMTVMTSTLTINSGNVVCSIDEVYDDNITLKKDIVESNGTTTTFVNENCLIIRSEESWW